MDMMIGDVKTDLTEGEHAEEMAQKDYENLMAASQKTRATNAESITEKESASAEWTEKIENAKTEQASTTEALAKVKEYIAGLHSSCDFLMENYGARKEARTNEVEGLKNAKSVLPGEAPLENILPYLEPKAVTSGIDVGCIVEIVTGAFKGEKARITSVSESKEEVSMELYEQIIPMTLNMRGDHVRVIERVGE